MNSAMVLKKRKVKLIQLAANPVGDDHKKALEEVLRKTRMKGKLDSERIKSLLQRTSLELSSYDSMGSDEERA